MKIQIKWVPAVDGHHSHVVYVHKRGGKDLPMVLAYRIKTDCDCVNCKGNADFAWQVAPVDLSHNLAIDESLPQVYGYDVPESVARDFRWGRYENMSVEEFKKIHTPDNPAMPQEVADLWLLMRSGGDKK